jgi:hypothetical protein
VLVGNSFLISFVYFMLTIASQLKAALMKRTWRPPPSGILPATSSLSNDLNYSNSLIDRDFRIVRSDLPSDSNWTLYAVEFGFVIGVGLDMQGIIIIIIIIPDLRDSSSQVISYLAKANGQPAGLTTFNFSSPDFNSSNPLFFIPFGPISSNL